MKGFYKEEKQFVKQFIAEFISYRINLRYLRYHNQIKDTYSQLFNSSLDQIIFNDYEKEEIYQEVDRILENKYKIILAHADKDKPLYLVNIESDSNERN